MMSRARLDTVSQDVKMHTAEKITVKKPMSKLEKAPKRRVSREMAVNEARALSMLQRMSNLDSDF